MDDADFYELLQVPRGASAEAIRRAYRQRALAVHPDRPGTRGESRGFQRVQEAYAVLSDAVARSVYDSRLQQQQRRDVVEAPDFIAEALAASTHSTCCGGSSVAPDVNDVWQRHFRERNGKVERRAPPRPASTTNTSNRPQCRSARSPQRLAATLPRPLASRQLLLRRQLVSHGAPPRAATLPSSTDLQPNCAHQRQRKQQLQQLRRAQAALRTQLVFFASGALPPLQ